ALVRQPHDLRRIQGLAVEADVVDQSAEGPLLLRALPDIKRALGHVELPLPQIAHADNLAVEVDLAGRAAADDDMAPLPGRAGAGMRLDLSRIDGELEAAVFEQRHRPVFPR